MRIVPRLQACVGFSWCDATRSLPSGEHDFIACRNVLSGLTGASRRNLGSALLAALAPGGTLLVARDEVAELAVLGVESYELVPGIAVCRRPVR